MSRGVRGRSSVRLSVGRGIEVGVGLDGLKNDMMRVVAAFAGKAVAKLLAGWAAGFLEDHWFGEGK